MHITFACLLCKISNELETPSLASVSLHLKSNTDNNTKNPTVVVAGFAVGCGWKLFPAPLYIYHDATLITLAKTAQKITAVAGGEREKKKKKGKKKKRKKEGGKKKKLK